MKRILDFDGTNEKESCFINYCGLNDRFLFFCGYAYSHFTGDKSRFAFFVLNRYDGNSLFRHINCNTGWCFIYNNEVFLDNCNSSDFFLVSDLNSDGNDKSVTRVRITQKGMFEKIYSTSNYKYICSERFDADNLIVKFDLY